MNEQEEIIKKIQRKYEEKAKQKELDLKYEIELLKKEQEQKIQDLDDFLKALDEMKNKMLIHFNNDAIVLTIYSYCRNVLLEMYDSDNIEKRIKYEQKLINLLEAVSLDIESAKLAKESNNLILPKKTIKFIRQSESLESQKIRDESSSFIPLIRSIVGGASLGAIIGTPLGFIGSAVGAGIGSVVIPFLVSKEESKIDNQNSMKQSNES